MSELPIPEIGFGQYQPVAGARDEAHDGNGWRQHWRSLFAGLARAGSLDQALPQLADQVERQRAELAFTAAADDSARPRYLDPLPLVISAHEWQILEAGLLQRCKLLNLIVADLYGGQSLLTSGTLPPALMFANPAFVLQATGTSFSSDPLQLLAFDLGRSADGQWWVLGNRTEAPTGLGYLLENRIAIARCLPELIQQENIERLAGFYQRFGDSLQQQTDARPADEGLNVILTDGPLGSGYSEHAYLGRYLGLPVITGDDLTVRGDRVYLKTLDGLKPVRAIARQLNSLKCDPLELRSKSGDGTPGLLHCARRGTVTISNAIGSGVVENNAFMSFLPGLSEHLLDEPLRLPSVATWWCGQPEEAQFVLDHLPALQVQEAFDPERLASMRVADYSARLDAGADRDALRAAIRQRPYQWVGRDAVKLSTAPFYSAAAGLAAGPVTLRLYAARTLNGYELLPGGLVRVATDRGDVSKDLWVQRVDGRASLPSRPVLRVTRRSDRNLPSSTGDDLFWLGRYLERTEGAVRLYRALFRALAGDARLVDEPMSLTQTTDLLVTMQFLSRDTADRAEAGGLEGVQRQLWELLFDSNSVDGLDNILANVQRTANHVRSRLSTDSWRLFESLGQVPNLRWRMHNVTDVIRLLNDVIDKLSALAGKSAENMTRSYGWRLMEIGKRVERTRFTLRLLRELCTRAATDSTGALHLLLDVTDTAITHRARYRSEPALLTVVDLLLIDGSNPRSVMHQINEIVPHITVMPLEPGGDELSDSRRILLTAQNALTLAQVDRLTERLNKQGVRMQLDRLLKDTEHAMVNLTRLLTQTYFAHTRSDRH